MNNLTGYGFRWAKEWPGQRDIPGIIPRYVASAASFDPSGGTANCVLGPGDVVNEVSDGTVFFCQGTENAQTPRIPYAVVVGVYPFFDASLGSHGAMRWGTVLPSDVAWGTNINRASKVACVPITAGVWEVDIDETSASWDTEAEFRDMIGENVDMINTNSPTNRLAPKLDISSNATTATLYFRIVGISRTVENQDFSGTGVKLLVRANISSTPEHAPLGV
jgi:hypothetical protein